VPGFVEEDVDDGVPVHHRVAVKVLRRQDGQVLLMPLL
jgi:hypothetical protein